MMARRVLKRPMLLPLVPLYRSAVALRNLYYDRLARPAVLHDPVVSVGSLSAGGAGKTPFLLALATLLQANGYAPDVLSRGYGRSPKHTPQGEERTSGGGVLQVDPRGTARQFGDEPLMLARALDVPVFVGSSRYDAGRLAEQQAVPRRIHLLDDGFNHRRLARTVDIALLTREDLADSLLPAGNLREPLGRLSRADVVVLRAPEAPEVEPLARALAGEGKPVWLVTRRLVLPDKLPERPVVFSALARPADFEAAVRGSGVHAVHTRRFRDHHFCTEAEIQALCRAARDGGANGFVTTAKDAVKLTPPMLARLRQVGTVAVADVAVDFQSPAEVMQDLQRLLPIR